MTYRFTVTFHSCGSCVSHSHCPTCCEQAVRDLQCRPVIRSVSLDPAKKLLTLTSTADQDTLEDLLDDLGIFAER